eukprot:SAG11_NODE_2551_length_3229_cov_2.569649_1_plen_45_part_10
MPYFKMALKKKVVFQNWSQKFLGLSIDAFFCPERLAEILWETENP